MKRFYLIDLENVGRTFLEGINKLTVEDTIIVCHNKVLADTIHPDIKDRLKLTKATVKQLTIDNTKKNAMDFCLCTQLGFLLAENGNCAKYYIVSKDRGFDVVKDFVKSINSKAEVKRIISLKSDFDEEENYNKEKQQLEELLVGHNPKVIKITRRCMDNSKTCFEFHNTLQKNLYPNEFADVYKKVKHLFSA